MIEILEKIYHQNESSNATNQQTMQKYSHGTLQITKLIIALYALCGVVFIVSPFFIYWIFGAVELILPIFIPFVDPTEKSGYIITTCCHVYFVFVACSGYSIADSSLIDLIIHMLLCSDLLRHDLQTLNEMLVKNKYEPIEVRLRFRNILQMHKEIKL